LSHPSIDFRAFYARYCRTVTRFLGKNSVDASHIEDIAQWVWLKIARNLHTVPPKGARPWIHRICSQQIAEHYRPLCNRNETPHEDLAMNVINEIDLHRRLEINQVVVQVLEAMNEEDAELLLAHDLDEVPLTELAEQEGVSENTMQRRIVRLRGVFKAKMKRALPKEDANRPWLAALPLGLRELYPARGPEDPAELDRLERAVWRRVARELGLDEEPPASEPPASGTRPSIARTEPPPSLDPTPGKNLLRGLWRALKKPGVMVVALVGLNLAADAGTSKARGPTLEHLNLYVGIVPMATDGAEGDRPGATSLGYGASSPEPTALAASSPNSPRGNAGVPVAAADAERRSLSEARKLLHAGSCIEALNKLQQHLSDYPDSSYAVLRQECIDEAQRCLRQGTTTALGVRP
jgi:RNA polymerase sigma-70 factor (ECF subfamily)